MNDVVVGLIAIAVGLFLSLRGHWALRILLAVWGAFIGLAVGGGLVQQISGGGFLGTVAGWVLGLVLAVVFGLIAYLYYAVSVVLGMGAMGFVLGGTLASALGASQTWLLTTVGVIVGIVLAVAAIMADLPAVLLVVISAAAGASLIVGGVMLVVGSASVHQLTEGKVSAGDHPVWYVAYVVLFVIGVVAQLRALAGLRRAHMREVWAAPH